MAQIIQFPVKKQAVSNGYENLSRLIAVAATKEVLNFYVEIIEQLEKTGKLLDGEAQKLTEQGREKRLEIAKPDPIEKEPVEAPGVYRYTPEMGGKKPDCQMEASRGYYGKPFATYQLSNNNAEIHRIEGRLKKLRAAKTEGNTESENEYFRTAENAEIMRLQLFFDGKPEAEVRDILKKNGFRWSRKNNCWQRQLTDNARYSLERVKKELEALK